MAIISRSCSKVVSSFTSTLQLFTYSICYPVFPQALSSIPRVSHQNDVGFFLFSSRLTNSRKRRKKVWKIGSTTLRRLLGRPMSSSDWETLSFVVRNRSGTQKRPNNTKTTLLFFLFSRLTNSRKHREKVWKIGSNTLPGVKYPVNTAMQPFASVLQHHKDALGWTCT